MKRLETVEKSLAHVEAVQSNAVYTTWGVSEAMFNAELLVLAVVVVVTFSSSTVPASWAQH
ncbi:hypothetical protein B0T16DRAFT_452293 [Cercophora newfieldiana]|uniref:Uncharacterized protein n=1 Tax=Cercophora newfieldiana TaxID=92897 RepID=A0AA39YQF5_9PEZI|nr:hypothetical protein B0T16DRAFT_452293 [Cercophora newfieldiana]